MRLVEHIWGLLLRLHRVELILLLDRILLHLIVWFGHRIHGLHLWLLHHLLLPGWLHLERWKLLLLPLRLGLRLRLDESIWKGVKRFRLNLVRLRLWLLHWKNIKKIRLRLHLITFGVLRVVKELVYRNASSWHGVIIDVIVVLVEHVKCLFLGLLWLSLKYPTSSSALFSGLEWWKIWFADELQKVELLVHFCGVFGFAYHFIEDHILVKFIQHVAIEVNFFFMVNFSDFFLLYPLLLDHGFYPFLLWSLTARSHNNF